MASDLGQVLSIESVLMEASAISSYQGSNLGHGSFPPEQCSRVRTVPCAPYRQTLGGFTWLRKNTDLQPDVQILYP